jgi:hypothetical protein
MLSRALDARTDLTDLTELHPDLARQFLRLMDDLDVNPLAPRIETEQRDLDPATAARRETDRRHQLARDFDQTLRDIRALPGFERFLLPSRFGNLLPAADRGPIVLVNVSDIRSDALVLRHDAVTVVPLPRLTKQNVKDRFANLFADLKMAKMADIPDEWRRALEESVSNSLAWLWDSVAGPVLDRLGITNRPESSEDWQRIWWCPSGLLTVLPLHAAGHHDTRFDSVPQTVMDRVISSYTPTVGALLHSRRQADNSEQFHSHGQVIVVAMPRTPAATDLPGARDEAALLKDLFGEQATVLEGMHCTHGIVQAALPHFPWAHFACHGANELADPSASHLLLYDHQQRPLTAFDIVHLRLRHAELAFLSACSTARTGRRPDEVIHLASAFHLAGYRHVIATLWPIADRPAIQVATQVYKELAADQNLDKSAAALQHAARRLRAILPNRPSIWAAHIHHGA